MPMHHGYRTIIYCWVACLCDAFTRFQMIYACGKPIALPGGRERAQAIQAVLHILSDAAYHVSGAYSILHEPGVAVWGTTDR